MFFMYIVFVVYLRIQNNLKTPLKTNDKNKINETEVMGAPSTKKAFRRHIP